MAVVGQSTDAAQKVSAMIGMSANFDHFNVIGMSLLEF